MQVDDIITVVFFCMHKIFSLRWKTRIRYLPKQSCNWTTMAHLIYPSGDGSYNHHPKRHAASPAIAASASAPRVRDNLFLTTIYNPWISEILGYCAGAEHTIKQCMNDISRAWQVFMYTTYGNIDTTFSQPLSLDYKFFSILYKCIFLMLRSNNMMVSIFSNYNINQSHELQCKTLNFIWMSCLLQFTTSKLVLFSPTVYLNIKMS